MSDEDNIIDDDEVLGDEPADASGGGLTEAAVALADKEAERRRLQADVEAFLARGGQIDHIESNVITDVPKKPESKYGGQPI